MGWVGRDTIAALVAPGAMWTLVPRGDTRFRKWSGRIGLEWRVYGVLGGAAIEDSMMSPENVRALQYQQEIVIFVLFGLCWHESSPGRRPFS